MHDAMSFRAVGVQPDFNSGRHELGLPFVLFQLVANVILWQLIVSVGLYEYVCVCVCLCAKRWCCGLCFAS